ncbi:hypothetical protein DFH08DRAFT_926901 [Mycena albidolilacea]|uniref:Uncharacterized protein n=1 Tax=Mycena albidolilacea TaxID=1033008 RepID=A0AAD6ZC14_9AGAR|nr:hypothetical protein DFH08DRAFT_926901 [Mycena albidolilacea]
MVLCQFCNRSFGDRGLQTHIRKCAVRLERLSNAAAHAAGTIAAEAENLAAASAAATAAAAAQPDFAADEVFPNQPTHDPEDSISLDDLCQSSDLLTENTETGQASTPPWFPFLNGTVARLMSWFHLGSTVKSNGDLDSIVHDVMLHEDFKQTHLHGFSAAREHKRLDDAAAAAAEQSIPGKPPAGWKTGSVKIKLPAPKNCTAEADAPKFEVPGIMYRPLLDVLVEAFQSPAFLQYHITPFAARWDPEYDPNSLDTAPDDTAPVDEQGLPPLPPGHQPVYGEVYTSAEMLEMHQKLPTAATEPYLETIIAAYMLWSDSTHLANFGTASLWPLYTFFGNLSKYIRAKPTSNSGYHQAYFPSLPDSIKDFYKNLFGIVPSADVLAHLKRELMHAVWDLLLTPEFIHAYAHGIVVKCYDGIERRIFPRFFTYGADYPEKVLLATIKYFGGCPCPRCFVEKDQIADMGTKADMRRRQKIREDTSSWRDTIGLVHRWIFDKGALVASAAVNRLLKPQSWVPTKNAFSKLVPHGLNLFSMFVPDLLHEVELGVVKSLFIHTLRILQAHRTDAIAIVDERFRKIPTFGRSTIRRFHANVSEMKKLAARDFEDLLQCMLPVIDGILPDPYNNIILDLWYILTTWHVYAKLRMHKGSTIKSFWTVTSVLGAKVRQFIRDVCTAYTTYELPKETRQRARRTAQTTPSTGASNAATTRKRKDWNISTYKYHSLGDYPAVMPRMGTTDSYSTQLCELTHRVVKKLYSRTNKHNFQKQIASHEQPAKAKAADEAGDGPAESNLRPQDEVLPRTSPSVHHHISQSTRNPFNVYEFHELSKFANDPSGFLKKLRAHLLSRLLDIPYDGDEVEFSQEDLMNVTFTRDRIYAHQVMRINYTTYDVQRTDDSINPRTNSDVMVLSHEDEGSSNPHPYWYARVLGIFHADIGHLGPKSKSRRPKRMEFLWVRWFGRDLSHKSGWKAKRLDRLGFIDSADPAAFGFLDPAEVIRASHIVPAFRYGRTSDLLPKSIARRPEDDDQDYIYY